MEKREFTKSKDEIKENLKQKKLFSHILHKFPCPSNYRIRMYFVKKTQKKTKKKHHHKKQK